MTKLSDFNPLGDTLQLACAEALLRNDAVQLNALTSKITRVRNTDNAAVATVSYGTAQTSAATGQIVAQTTVVSGATNAYARQAVLQKPDGSILTFTCNAAGSQGLLLTNYASSGALSGRVIVNATTAVYSNHHIFQLSNGNIAAVAYNPNGPYISFYICDANLNTIKSLTSISADPTVNYYFSAVALSAGGFAVVYQQNANPLLSRLATFDSTGTAVLAPTTIWTRTGTSGIQYHKMAQLSNGNLAIAVSSVNTVSNIGLYHGVVTTDGASVAVFSNIDSSAVSWYPEISTVTGFYCVAINNGTTNQLAFVFNNSGALQGAGFTSLTIGGGAFNQTKLVNDGAAFWLIWPRSLDSKAVLTKLPTTGTDYTTTDITTSPTQYNFFIDAFYEYGYIVGVSQSGISANAPTVWVINIKSGLLVNTSGTTFGATSAASNGYNQRVISGGDGAFICLYDYTSTAATNLCVGKYANTAIIGVCSADTVAGGLAPIRQGPGAYKVNAITGSSSKGFDMSGTPYCYGNKGTVFGNALVIKGM